MRNIEVSLQLAGLNDKSVIIIPLLDGIGEVAAFRALLIAAGMVPSTADELLSGTIGPRNSQASAQESGAFYR